MGLKELVLLRIAKRWISGVDLSSAIKDAQKANSGGMGAVINFLGEDIMEANAADSHAEEYFRLQNLLADKKIDGFPSVKLTQLGLALGQSDAAMRLESIAANSDRLKQWLWLDMEGSKYIDETISLYKSAHEKHPRLGLALQAYSKRSGSDLSLLLEGGAKVRLVKGAYREGPDFAVEGRKQVRDNFSKLMTELFDRSDGFAIGTHDSVLIDQAKRLAESRHVDFRFEMLKGIRDDLKTELVNTGYKVSEYLPYGDRWYSYSKRRMTEHPSNIWLLLRSLV